jgi:hypothetical protein
MAVATTRGLIGGGYQKQVKFPLKQPKAKVIEPSAKQTAAPAYKGQ